MSGASGLFGVALKPGLPAGALSGLIDASELFGRGVSWGGYESLMIPVNPERTVTRFPFEGRLFRISAGLEDADDLVADLERSFAALRAVR
jgi:cystathionine beta-lyase